MEKLKIDHIDIVTSHICNKHCEHCIDKFLHTTKEMIKLEDIKNFLDLIRTITNEKLEVLLLGGEPTVLPKDKLIEIAKLVHDMNFKIIMSSNGILKNKIMDILPYYDSIQVTVNNDQEIDYYKKWSDKINIKLAGDESLNMEKLNHFIEYTEGFDRRSISMYFKPDFTQLCYDEEIWNLLNTLVWQRNGSYMYTFYHGVRIKKCVDGETNIIDEPTVPKLYPNGNYNKTWNNEDLDDYLSLPGNSWVKRKSLYLLRK